MTKSISFLTVLILFVFIWVFMSPDAHAETIAVEFSYSATVGNEPTGYNIYMDDLIYCSVTVDA